MPPETEPTTTATNPDAGAAAPTEYDALLSAAKAATAEFAKSKPPPSGTSLAAETSSAETAEASPAEARSGIAGDTAAPEAAADDANTVARLLKAKNRETAQKQRDEADAYMARRKAEADAEYERRAREADERARALEREAEERVRRRIEELTSTEEVLGAQAQKGDPLFQLAKRFEADLKARDGVIEEMQKKLAALQEDGQERDRGFTEARTKLAERNFMAKATEDKYPHAVAYWDGEGELLARAKAVLSDARAEAEKRGEQFACPDDDVLAFLETEAKERLTRKRDLLSKLLSPVESESVPEKPGNAPRGKTGQTRTLSASAASERRASPKPISEMSEAEAELAMRQAASSAFRSK